MLVSGRSTRLVPMRRLLPTQLTKCLHVIPIVRSRCYAGVRTLPLLPMCLSDRRPGLQHRVCLRFLHQAEHQDIERAAPSKDSFRTLCIVTKNLFQAMQRTYK